MKRAFFKNLSILILVFYLVLVKMDTSEAIYEEKYSQIIWSYLEKLCALGPRNPGSKGYIKTIELIRRVGEKYANRVVEKPFWVQISEKEKVRMVNLELQFAGTEGGTPIIIGSHFDTRPFADREIVLEKRDRPVSYTHLTLPTILLV